MLKVEIYVINMESSLSRRDSISKQFKELDLPFHFFKAVNGNSDCHSLFDKYNSKKRLLLRGKPLVNGQLGCFASHYLLWEKCVDEGRPMIILEDDACIEQELFLSFYNAAISINDKYECIRLFKNKSKNNRYSIESNLTHDMSVAKFTKGHMSTTGYYITPSAAKQFLREAHQWVFPVDIYMDRFWSNKVECYGLVPPCVGNDEVFDSDINYAKNTKRYSFKVKITRELFAFSESIRRAIWNSEYSIQRFLKKYKA
jgi:glycosyl transferase, family 25